MHKTFISYHHDGEQDLKDNIITKFGGDDFIDKSVSDGDIDPDLSEETIMNTIRDDYIHDATVTVVIVGWETATRPYVNSEIQASLRDTSKNKHTGLLAIIRDELYDYIYKDGKCNNCGASIRIKDESAYKTYIPNLIIKNHEYDGDKCHYNGNDVYCANIKYSTFISDPESYINDAFDKREQAELNISKIPDPGTPGIGK